MSGILSATRSARSPSSAPRRSRCRSARRRMRRPSRWATHRSAGRAGPAGGDRLERLAGQPQFAGAVDLRVAGQDLLDQRRPRPRQAEDEDRPARVVAPPGGPREELRVERLEQAVDEPLVVGRVVLARCLGQLLAQRVGLRGGIRRRGRIRPARRARGPGRRGAGRRAPANWGSASRCSSAAGPPRGACRGAGSPAGRAAGRSSAALERRPEGRLGLAQVALLLVEPAQVELGRGRVGLDPQGRLVLPRASASRPSSWRAQPSERCTPGPSASARARARSKQGMASPGSSRSTYSSARNSWKVELGRVQLDGPLQPGQGVAELALADHGQAEVGVGRARSGSSRRASR